MLWFGDLPLALRRLPIPRHEGNVRDLARSNKGPTIIRDIFGQPAVQAHLHLFRDDVVGYLSVFEHIQRDAPRTG